MGIFNKIADFFKREIELNKEYYENLKKEQEPDLPQVATEQQKRYELTNTQFITHTVMFKMFFLRLLGDTMKTEI